MTLYYAHMKISFLTQICTSDINEVDDSNPALDTLKLSLYTIWKCEKPILKSENIVDNNKKYTLLYLVSLLTWNMLLLFFSLLFSCIVYTLSGKPNSMHDSADGEEDGTYHSVHIYWCSFLKWK